MDNQIKAPINADEVRAAAKAKATAIAKDESDKPRYTYEVTQPCHRDGLYYDPEKWKQDGGEGPLLHVASEPQVSMALKPADEATEEATEAQKLVFAEVKRKKDLAAHPELAELVRKNAELEAQLTKAIAALQKAASK
jgi:hypothetical protein